MIFEYNGREFDTDNRIYVLGYKITSSWFPLYIDDPHSKSRVDEYGPTVVGAYVQTLLFDAREVDGKKKNVLVGLGFDFSKASGFVGNRAREGYIIGRTAKECLKVYQEKTTSKQEG